MKIRCDVCNEAEASVFCSADEAALCHGCDHRVHHANKLASKHTRFSLLHPNTLKEAPLCDVCQERRAFLFCREDRAILCRECDVPIHKANEHTQKHNRFLLTGVKLSTSSSLYPSIASPRGCEEDFMAASKASLGSHLSSSLKKTNCRDSLNSPSTTERTTYSMAGSLDENNGSDSGSVSASSISEYLEMLPGWRVDDFLDPSLVSSGFNKVLYAPYM